MVPPRRFLVTRRDIAACLALGFCMGLLACGLLRFLWPGFFRD